jgi:hypothetical protein
VSLCRALVTSRDPLDPTTLQLMVCGKEAHYCDALGRPLCSRCAAEVQLEGGGDNVFGPAPGRRLLIASVH